MTDLTGEIEVYIITNGRSTFSYCKQSVKNQQDVRFRLSYHENMKWIDANRKILDDCRSRFFIRVDDDMFLHPKAISFIWSVVKNAKNKVALHQWRLWEPYSNKVCKGIKAYNTVVAQDIGFRPNEIGKIDKNFTADAEKKGYKLRSYNDVIAVHACASLEEHLNYAKMRGEHHGQRFSKKKKWMEEKIGNFDMSLSEQYKISHGNFIFDRNKERNTDFYRFLKNE